MNMHDVCREAGREGRRDHCREVFQNACKVNYSDVLDH